MPHVNQKAVTVRLATRRLLPVLALFPIGSLASAHNVKAASLPPLSVEIAFNGAPMPPKLEASAIAEARVIWAPYGVDVHGPGASVVDHDAVRLNVTFVERESRAAPDALGSIQFDDGVPEPAIALYPNAITSLISTAEPFGRNLALRHLIVWRVLGRALAHEIGHYLLRTRQHSRTGLMRALQPIADLVAADRSGFVLSRDEMARLASTMPAHVPSASFPEVD